MDLDVVAVPIDAWTYLSKIYGYDTEILVPRNTHCESWQTSLTDRYEFLQEEVRLLILMQHEHKVKGITILDRHG